MKVVNSMACLLHVLSGLGEFTSGSSVARNDL